jgi:dihydroxyacid dehydratase/phosphogluconate dehydratase
MLRNTVLQHAVHQMNCTSFASQGVCEGTMTARQGMAVAMNAFGNARHAQTVLELCNPMAPQKSLELED